MYLFFTMLAAWALSFSVMCTLDYFFKNGRVEVGLNLALTALLTVILALFGVYN